LFFYLPFEPPKRLPTRACRRNDPRVDNADLLNGQSSTPTHPPLRPLSHRNAVLDRSTNAQEQAFLDGGGFTGLRQND